MKMKPRKVVGVPLLKHEIITGTETPQMLSKITLHTIHIRSSFSNCVALDRPNSIYRRLL